MKCTSCHINLTSEDNFTKFKCPSCEERVIIRCATCRKKGTLYICDKCNFEGP